MRKWFLIAIVAILLLLAFSNKALGQAETGVDLLWEAEDAYVPPFYRGKMLAPPEGMFKVVALPNLRAGGRKISSKDLSYNWKQDDNSQPDASGLGRNYFIFKNSYLDTNNKVAVAISSLAGNAIGAKSIILQTRTPKIIFYEEDPVLGIKFERSVGDGFFLNPNGSTLAAMPYFFSPKNINSSSLEFSWFLNGLPIDTPETKNVISLKPEEGTSGQASIKVEIKNSKTLFQSAEKEINVSF